jgi:hypothetical protein
VASDSVSASDTAAPETTAAETTAATATSGQILTSLGAYADHASLASVRPASPSTVALRVYNSSAVRGQAKAVTDELRAAGFESILDGANDPLYPAADLRCVAQIRFGPAGAAAARTVLLVAPCAQLVVDDRVDDSVDLSLGGRYIYDSVSDDVRAQLKAIQEAATPPAVIEGQTAAAKPLPVARPDSAGALPRPPQLIESPDRCCLRTPPCRAERGSVRFSYPPAQVAHRCRTSGITGPGSLGSNTNGRGAGRVNFAAGAGFRDRHRRNRDQGRRR